MALVIFYISLWAADILYPENGVTAFSLFFFTWPLLILITEM